jgi:transcriptional regulator with XRE-family HTH domain
MSLLKIFGERLRQLRKEQGLSVAEVAAAVDCDVSSIYSIEKGRHAPSFQRLLELAELLKCDELDLLCFPTQHPRHELIELSRNAPLGTVTAMKAACQKVLEQERRLKGPRTTKK